MKCFKMTNYLSFSCWILLLTKYEESEFNLGMCFRKCLSFDFPFSFYQKMIQQIKPVVALL